MNKKLFLFAAIAWAASFGLIYYFRLVIAVAALSEKGVPDKAFTWLPEMERAVVMTALLFSFLLYCFGGLAYWLASRRKAAVTG